jgi:hypothetical protein
MRISSVSRPLVMQSTTSDAGGSPDLSSARLLFLPLAKSGLEAKCV